MRRIPSAYPRRNYEFCEETEYWDGKSWEHWRRSVAEAVLTFRKVRVTREGPRGRCDDLIVLRQWVDGRRVKPEPYHEPFTHVRLRAGKSG